MAKGVKVAWLFQQPEMLEIVARYMEHAADLGSEEALAWLRDYHEVDDSRHHPYV